MPQFLVVCGVEFAVSGGELADNEQADVERFVPITHVPLYVLQPMFIVPVVIVRLYSLTSQHLKLISSGSDKQE